MLIYRKYFTNLNADSRKMLYICAGNIAAQLKFIIMKKLFYYLLWPFNWLYDCIYESCSDYEDGFKKPGSRKVVYLVIGETWCPDDGITVCSVCDNEALADVYADDVRKFSETYRKVYVDSYTLNNLDLF